MALPLTSPAGESPCARLIAPSPPTAPLVTPNASEVSRSSLNRERAGAKGNFRSGEIYGFGGENANVDRWHFRRKCCQLQLYFLSKEIASSETSLFRRVRAAISSSISAPFSKHIPLIKSVTFANTSPPTSRSVSPLTAILSSSYHVSDSRELHASQVRRY